MYFFCYAGKLQPEAVSILFRSDVIMSFNNILFHIQTAYSAQLSLVLLSWIRSLVEGGEEWFHGQSRKSHRVPLLKEHKSPLHMTIFEKFILCWLRRNENFAFDKYTGDWKCCYIKNNCPVACSCHKHGSAPMGGGHTAEMRLIWRR